MLSELARACGLALRDRVGPQNLIFPAPDRLGGAEATFTNKIVAVVDDPQAAAEVAERGLRARLEELRAKAFEGIAGTSADGRPRQPLFLEARAAEQIADLIEVQWAAVPFSGPDEYKPARDQAEALLAARKNTRLWGPVTWSAEVPKSSIDGQRESVLHESLFDADSGLSSDELYRTFRVGENERLCGVGLLKRLGVRAGSRHAHHFLSTGHVAAWPLLERIAALAENPEHKAMLESAWKGFTQALEAAGCRLEDLEVFQKGYGHPVLGVLDASLLFEQRLPDLFAEIQVAQERRRTAEPATRKLREVLELAGVGAPCPYFAVLVADGDRMGATIERIGDLETHRKLSSILTSFAERARAIVEKIHYGELVFAGGDDVLAFVPLHRAVACGRALAEDFRQRLQGLPIDSQGTATPTLSVGIGVAHFREPLSSALDLARAAEREAKKSRDALAILVDKRSGPPLAVAGRWGDVDLVLDDFVELHTQDLVPDGMAYELSELARLPRGTNGKERETLTALVRKEAERILRRKQPKHGEKAGIAAKELARLGHVYDRLAARLGAEALTAFADQLILARFFAEARMQAQGPLPPSGQEEAR